ncbi:MAG: hypothetical protein ACYC7A_01365 [Thermoanaerobaculia bacterium]
MAEQETILLLRAEVSANSNNDFTVGFPYRHPDIRSIEHVRIVLHYYAKMMFLFDRSSPRAFESGRWLLDVMQRLQALPISTTTDLFTEGGMTSYARMVASVQRPGTPYTAELHFISAARRHIITYFDDTHPNFGQMALSVLALMAAAIRQVDQEEIDVLRRGISQMTSTYMDVPRSRAPYLELEALHRVPNEAFLRSILGDVG